MRPDLKTGVSVADENISEDKTENSTVQNLFLISRYKKIYKWKKFNMEAKITTERFP